MWFSLTLRIIKEYITEEEDRDEAPDGLSTPVLPKRGRVSIKFGIPTLKRKHTQTELGSASSTTQDEPEDQWETSGGGFEPVGGIGGKKKMSILSKSSGDTAGTDLVEEEQVAKAPPTFMHRDRRPPIMTRYSEFEFLPSSVASTPTGGLTVGTPTGHASSKQIDVTSNLYKIFKLSVKVCEKLHVCGIIGIFMKVTKFCQCYSKLKFICTTNSV